MKTIYLVLLTILITIPSFSQKNTNDSEIKSESCTPNYFTQKDRIHIKFEKIYPKSQLLSLDMETCKQDPIKIEVVETFNSQIIATLYLLQNSNKLNRN